MRYYNFLSIILINIQVIRLDNIENMFSTKRPACSDTNSSTDCINSIASSTDKTHKVKVQPLEVIAYFNSTDPENLDTTGKKLTKLNSSSTVTNDQTSKSNLTELADNMMSSTSPSNEVKHLDDEEEDFNLLNSCEVICLQPDTRLCQCAKDEINKYYAHDPTQKQGTSKKSDTLPHIYMSEREKQTCDEYTIKIRKLNIAISLKSVKDFYFEPTIDFHVESPPQHTISNLFFWGDFIAIYQSNPYVEYDDYLPGCIWQIPSGINSYYSTITINSCRNQLMSTLNTDTKVIYLCIWSYERYWYNKQLGPCQCCEMNFSECLDCYACIKSNLELNHGSRSSSCLENDGINSNSKSFSCYRCLDFKNPSMNCQDYSIFLSKLFTTNKYSMLTNIKRKNFDGI